MKFLADENVSVTLLKGLRNAGFEVIDVKEKKLFGLPDEKILEMAVKNKLTILTHDKDFLNLTKRIPVDHFGIIILRFRNQNPFMVTERFLSILHSTDNTKFERAVVIVSDKYIEKIND
jgi:predicted nuclease of predicted toxin-antitoxin system